MTGKMKWILGILGVSLVLNVFALGLFVGKGARTVVPTRERMAPPADFNFKRLERNLPEGERQKVRKLLREKSGDLRRGYRALREVEKEIKAIVLAETVDVKALKEVLTKHGEQAQALHEPMRWVILETIAGLDFETRKKIVEDMFRGPRKGRMGHRPPPHHRPPHGRHRPPPPDHDECFDCDDETLF
ncbi:MAG: periplasmic heavy metal sensor [Kordiimonas sp.]